MGRTTYKVGIFGYTLKLLPSVCLLISIHAAFGNFHSEVVFVDTVKGSVSKYGRLCSLANNAAYTVTTFKGSFSNQVYIDGDYKPCNSGTIAETTGRDANNILWQRQNTCQIRIASKCTSFYNLKFVIKYYF